MKPDLLHTALLITAASAERHGIPNPTGRDFRADELADAHAGLQMAERDLYGAWPEPIHPDSLADAENFLRKRGER